MSTLYGQKYVDKTVHIPQYTEQLFPSFPTSSVQTWEKAQQQTNPNKKAIMMPLWFMSGNATGPSGGSKAVAIISWFVYHMICHTKYMHEIKDLKKIETRQQLSFILKQSLFCCCCCCWSLMAPGRSKMGHLGREWCFMSSGGRCVRHTNIVDLSGTSTISSGFTLTRSGWRWIHEVVHFLFITAFSRWREKL